MSSPRSPRPADGLAALGAAALQVAEDSLFAYAEPCEPTRTAGLVKKRPVPEAWLARRSRSPARSTASCGWSLPQALGADLAGAFCGRPAAVARRGAGHRTSPASWPTWCAGCG